MVTVILLCEPRRLRSGGMRRGPGCVGRGLGWGRPVPAESPVCTRHCARRFPSLLLLKAPRWPFDWHMFISLLQIWKLRPREGESFESDHTPGERKSQNWNLRSLSPGPLLFLSALPGCLRDSARVYPEGQLPAWIWGDRDLRVGLPLLHIWRKTLDPLQQPNSSDRCGERYG